MYKLFSNLQAVAQSFLHFWHTFRHYRGVNRRDRAYRIAIVASNSDTSHLLGATIDSHNTVVICTESCAELLDIVRHVRFDLVIIASTELHIDTSALMSLIGDVRATGADLFVILRNLGVPTTLELLGCGVAQCMTFPVNLYRLRRKVKEHLAERVACRELTS